MFIALPQGKPRKKKILLNADLLLQVCVYFVLFSHLFGCNKGVFFIKSIMCQYVHFMYYKKKATENVLLCINKFNK